MNKRTIYKSTCPRGGVVQPSFCGHCASFDWEGTQAAWRSNEKGIICCNKDGRVETIIRRGRESAAVTTLALKFLR